MNKYETRSIKSYNKKAVNYDDTFDGRFTRKFKDLLIETIEIPSGGKMLDVACGNGRLLNMVAQKMPVSGFGTDISEKMVENARLLNPAMVFETAACDALPFEDDFFDAITVCAAFHHFPNVDRFAKEAWRVLKPGGMVYIAEIYLSSFLRIIFNPFVKYSRDGDVKFYGPEEITNLFTDAGFRSEVFKREGHIQIIAVRKVESEKGQDRSSV